jgi:hypothetical protein
MREFNHGDVRLYRNNVGMAYAGKPKKRGRSVFIANAYPVRYGLEVGSADLIGYRMVTITPDMVGRKLAVFASVECKDDEGKPSDKQEAWRAQIKAAGGLACVARSVEEARKGLYNQ